MTLIRWMLARVIMVADRLFRPAMRQHPPAVQTQLDAHTAHMALYQFAACPFCVKVRWAARRLGLTIALRDAKTDDAHRAALLQGGGKIKVPCLRTTATDGTDTWRYESSVIIQQLEQLVARTTTAAAA